MDKEQDRNPLTLMARLYAFGETMHTLTADEKTEQVTAFVGELRANEPFVTSSEKATRAYVEALCDAINLRFIQRKSTYEEILRQQKNRLDPKESSVFAALPFIDSEHTSTSTILLLPCQRTRLIAWPQRAMTLERLFAHSSRGLASGVVIESMANGQSVLGSVGIGGMPIQMFLVRELPEWNEQPIELEHGSLLFEQRNDELVRRPSWQTTYPGLTVSISLVNTGSVPDHVSFTFVGRIVNV